MSGQGRSVKGRDAVAGWSGSDTLAVALWLMIALAARAPLIALAEGILDHDQSVVGLMALDVAEGRRWPLFFDGQRYMGALEAYLAAGFVGILGHSPRNVALAPWVVFGGFVTGQFALWRVWRGKPTGHLAAFLSVVCGPMLTVWGIVPRGGYIEALAWMLPTLACYRIMARPGRVEPGPVVQYLCGLLFALGYFLNPLSLILYATLAIDWTFSRHGPDLRRLRATRWRWLDHPTAPLIWLLLGMAWLCLTTFFVHVNPLVVEADSPYVTLGGLVEGPAGRVIGVVGVLTCLALAAWWTGFLGSIQRLLVPRPWAVLGIMTALSPFVIQGLLARIGRMEAVPSLPVWLAAPWNAGTNIRNGISALGLLVGSDPAAVASVMVGQGIDAPETQWPVVSSALLGVSPLIVALVAVLIARVAWSGRLEWLRLARLSDGEPGSPERLCLLYLGIAGTLYLLQGTSPNASSVRYLVPVWVVLPGLLACGLASLPPRSRVLALAVLSVGWIGVQANVWAEIDRRAPAHRLARELEQRGIKGIVAQTPVAIVVANLTHGKVGALEYRPFWPRLGQRYRDRFAADGPVICVTDERFPWDQNGQSAWSPDQDLARALADLSLRNPGKVRRLWSIDRFDVWESDLPLDAVAPIGQGKPGVAPPTSIVRAARAVTASSGP